MTLVTFSRIGFRGTLVTMLNWRQVLKRGPRESEHNVPFCLLPGRKHGYSPTPRHVGAIIQELQGTLRKPARCYPITASGFTTTATGTSDQRGHMYRSVAQKRRSKGLSKGRGRFRLSTAKQLSQSEHFQQGFHATAEEHGGRSQEYNDHYERESTVVTSHQTLLWS